MRCLWERYEDVVPAYGGRESGGVPATARPEVNADRDNGIVLFRVLLRPDGRQEVRLVG
jgi:hypothetical protein